MVTHFITKCVLMQGVCMSNYVLIEVILCVICAFSVSQDQWFCFYIYL